MYHYVSSTVIVMALWWVFHCSGAMFLALCFCFCRSYATWHYAVFMAIWNCPLWSWAACWYVVFLEIIHFSLYAAFTFIVLAIFCFNLSNLKFVLMLCHLFLYWRYVSRHYTIYLAICYFNTFTTPFTSQYYIVFLFLWPFFTGTIPLL